MSRQDESRSKSVVCLASVATIALLLGPVQHASAQASDPKIALRTHRGQGLEQRINVLVLSRTPIGAYTFELTFDPSLAELVAIEGGTTPQFSAAPAVNRESFSSGTVRFSAFQISSMDAPTGRLNVATLVFRRGARASERKRIRVEIKAITLVATTGRPFAAMSRSRFLRFRAQP